MTTAAPSRKADAAAASPTGPAPATYTVEPVRDPGGHAAVVAGREDVGQHGQVEDLLHRLVLVREAQQVPVRVRHHHVLRLAADPAAHVDVAVRGTGPVRVDVEADPGLALLAVAAPPAGDVERHRAEVADLDELDVRSDLDHLAGDLVPEHQPGRRGGAAADHVLVAAADVGRDVLQDRGVRQLAADVRRVDPGTVLQLQRRVVGVLDLHLSRSHVGDCLVPGHSSHFLSRADAPVAVLLAGPAAGKPAGGLPFGREDVSSRRWTCSPGTTWWSPAARTARRCCSPTASAATSTCGAGWRRPSRPTTGWCSSTWSAPAARTSRRTTRSGTGRCRATRTTCWRSAPRWTCATSSSSATR